MKIKNHLTQNFMKAAARATLVAMLTVGTITPHISAAQTSVNLQEPATTITMVATTQEKQTVNPIEFTRVTDLDQLEQQHPFLAGIKAQVAEYDEIQGGTNPTLVDVGTFKDQANGREMIFVHITTPVMCSYEGCPLSFYIKDGKDNFNRAYQMNAIVPVKVISQEDFLSVSVPGAYGVGAGHELRYNNDFHKFERLEKPVEKDTASPLQKLLPQ